MTAAMERNLRKYKDLPVYIEEDHNEVVPDIHRAIASRHLPVSGIPMVHFDSHPDLLLPLHMQADHVFDREQLYSELSIENWIVPLAYAGHISDIYWLKPPWSDQISDRSGQRFFVGKHKDTGEIRMSLDDPYFLTEALYAPESQLTNPKQVTLHVITITPTDWTAEKGITEDTNDTKPTSPHSVSPSRYVNSVPKQAHLQHACHTLGSAQQTQERSPVCQENHEKSDTDLPSCAQVSQRVNSSEDDLTPPPAKVKKVDQSEDTASCHVKTANISDDVNNEKHHDKTANISDDVNRGKRILDNKPASGETESQPDKNWLTSLKQKLEGRPYILDIDLDFFSTKDPFQNDCTADEHALLQELFGFKLPANKTEKEALEFSRARQAQLDELWEVFQQLQQQPDSLPKVQDPHRQTVLDNFLGLLRKSSSDHPAPMDFEMLYRAGCTFDGTALPHHVSSPQQIGQLMDTTTDILTALPHPTIITMSRSSVDDYCPQSQVETIQDKMIDILTDTYKDIDVQKLYEQQL